MARCPRCTKHFRTLEDEDGMHDCPYCGYTNDPPPTCDWCNSPMPSVDDWGFMTYEPYCSSLCAAQAERDSEEDN